MSTIKVDTIKDETGANTLVTQSGSNYAWGAGVPKGSVIEQFASPCDGSAITVQSGTYTVQNVTGVFDVSNAWTAITGSTITYTPPTGTARVIYEFNYQHSYISERPIYSIKYSIGGTEVTNARHIVSAQYYLEGNQYFRWVHNIGGSATAATGRVASWTSGKELKVEARQYSASYQGQFHLTQHWEASGTDQFSQPTISITALA